MSKFAQNVQETLNQLAPEIKAELKENGTLRLHLTPYDDILNVSEINALSKEYNNQKGYLYDLSITNRFGTPLWFKLTDCLVDSDESTKRPVVTAVGIVISEKGKKANAES